MQQGVRAVATMALKLKTQRSSSSWRLCGSSHGVTVGRAGDGGGEGGGGVDGGGV